MNIIQMKLKLFFLSETIMANFTTKRPIAGMSAKVIEHGSSAFGIIFFAQVKNDKNDLYTHFHAIFYRFRIQMAFDSRYTKVDAYYVRNSCGV